jgi:hypothetical protein
MCLTSPRLALLAALAVSVSSSLACSPVSAPAVGSERRRLAPAAPMAAAAPPTMNVRRVVLFVPGSSLMGRA